MTGQNTITEIQKFLEGKNEKKYVVNVETETKDGFATCIVHEPNKDASVEKIPFTSFIYIKDLQMFLQ